MPLASNELLGDPRFTPAVYSLDEATTGAAAQRPNQPGAPTTSKSFKSTIKAALLALRLNELSDAILIEPFNVASALSETQSVSA